MINKKVDYAFADWTPIESQKEIENEVRVRGGYDHTRKYKNKMGD